MNRKNLTAAVLAGLAGAAGIAGTAQAVNLNPDGLGQVLVYPYYTVNGGNVTLLSVVNTTDDAKAVKVRFLESQNSREVLDFNLYMSEHDVWVAAIVNNNGTPTLVIEDKTCTVPDLLRDFGGMQPFLTFGLNDSNNENNSIDRTTEGHFEMIEMGTLVGDSAAAARHKYDGVDDDNGGDGDPSDTLTPATNGCAQLVNAWSVGPDDITGTSDDGYWHYNSNANLVPALTDIEDPSGGLFGGASIVNPLGGTMYSYEARAVNGYADSRDPFGVPLHTVPSNLAPSLGSGDVTTGYVFSDQGNLMWGDFFDPMDAVSYVFMHDAIMNEYVTQGSASGNSEWVITFPTKFDYVNGGTPRAPFTSVWKETSEVWGACEPVFLDTLWDQEEEEPGGGPGQDNCGPIVSPAPPQDRCGSSDSPFQLCYEANVIRFGAEDGKPARSEILGSSRYTNIDNVKIPNGTVDGVAAFKNFEAGWARIDLYAYPFDSDGNQQFDTVALRNPLGYGDQFFDGDSQYGLPATGFWVYEANNSFIQNPTTGENVLANYGGLFNHKATRCFSGEFCREDRLD